MPGAFNALSARVAADMGFEALYITGAGVTNMWLGMPDQAFIGLHEIAEHTARIRDTVDLPLIVDADTGFGNALNVLGRPREALAYLEQAVAILPDYPVAHYNAAMTRILLGDYKAGWAEYEWRWRTPWKPGSSPAASWNRASGACWSVSAGRPRKLCWVRRRRTS